MERAQINNIVKDLSKKMVFIAGPRQAGKTWLAQTIAKSFSRSVYLNYDSVQDREIMLSQVWRQDAELFIFDELHKMPEWRNYLKGVYDTKPDAMKMLVIGSAKLDIFKHAGDSLAGRYFMHRLLPLSPAELHTLGMPVDLAFLMERGGFPEPYLAESAIDIKRWRSQYLQSLIRIDALEFDNVQNIRAMQLIVELLQRRVGSPVSFQSIAEDVKVSPITVKKYIDILEALYIVFRVTPYSKNIARSLLKEPKIYFYDNGLVLGDQGAKLENLVANSLLRYVFTQQDEYGENYQLNYLRTKDGNEVDFVLSCDSVIQEIIEVKNSDHTVSKSLKYFSDKYQLNAIQLVANTRQEKQMGLLQILKAADYLMHL